MAKPVALVTGATSGIGRLAAVALAKRSPDWTILVSGRRTEHLAAQAAVIAREASSDNVTPQPADLSSLASMRDMVDALVARRQPIALLLLAAGRQASDARTVSG